jgi:hypothetical protein
MLLQLWVGICPKVPYLLECDAHLFWPNYVAKIRFDGALDSRKYGNIGTQKCTVYSCAVSEPVSKQVM